MHIIREAWNPAILPVMASALTQVLAPIKGGKLGTEAVVRERLTEEAQMAPVFSGARLVDLAEVLAGQGRRTWSLASGGDNERALALSAAPASSGNAEKDARAVAEWLAQDSRPNVETIAMSAVVPLPKTWSLLAMGDEDLRLKLQAAMPAAAQAYLDALQQESLVRIFDRSMGPGHEEVRERPRTLRGWSAGHGISGAGDPHLHLHILVATRAEGSSGRRGHLWQPQLLAESGRVAHGAAMNAFRQVIEEQGYVLDELGEIEGIGADRELIDRASRAHTSINLLKAAYASRGIHLSDEKAWERWRQLRGGHELPGLQSEVAAEIAAMVGEDRSAESLEHALDEDLSNDERRVFLVQHWNALYEVDLTKLATAARRAAATAPALTDVDYLVALVADARRSPKPATVRGWAAGIVGLDGADDLMARASADKRVIAGSTAWATVSRALDEIAIIERTEALVVAEEMSPGDALARLDLPLAVVSGVAGAGKTFLLREAAESWKEEGRRVWAVARNVLTANDVGRTVDCDSCSIARLAKLEATGKGPKRGSVLVVDEFGLLDHCDVQLILNLAERGVIVKGLGDEKQLSSIDGTTSARLLLETARRRGQPHLDISHRCAAWRETHDYLRAAVEFEGHPVLVARALDQLNIVPFTKAVEVVSLAEGAELVCATNLTRSTLAAAIARPPVPTDVNKVARIRDDQAVWVDDRVIIRENIWRYGDKEPTLANGDRGRVVLVNRTGVVIERDRDKHLVTLNREEAQRTLALGGVWTADSAQGQSFDKAVVVITGIEPGELLYSAATRSRAMPTFAVVVGEDVPVEQQQERAVEMVRRALERSSLDFSCVELAENDEQFADAAMRRGVPLGLFMGLGGTERLRAEEEAAQIRWKAEQEERQDATAQEAPEDRAHTDKLGDAVRAAALQRLQEEAEEQWAEYDAREAAVEAAMREAEKQEAVERAAAGKAKDAPTRQAEKAVDAAGTWHSEAELVGLMEAVRQRGEDALRRIPTVDIDDQAPIDAMYLAATKMRKEADKHTTESERLVDRAPAWREEAREDFITARDAAKTIENGRKRFSRVPAEKIEEAEAERARVAKKWNATVMPAGGDSDDGARWLGRVAFDAALEGRVTGEVDAAAAARKMADELKARADRAGQLRAVQVTLEDTNAKLRESVIEKARQAARPIRAARAERDRMAAAMTPEQIEAADKARDHQIAARNKAVAQVMLEQAREGRWAGSATHLRQIREALQVRASGLHPELATRAEAALRKAEDARAAAMEISPRLVALLDKASLAGEAKAARAEAATKHRSRAVTPPMTPPPPAPHRDHGYEMGM